MPLLRGPEEGSHATVYSVAAQVVNHLQKTNVVVARTALLNLSAVHVQRIWRGVRTRRKHQRDRQIMNANVEQWRQHHTSKRLLNAASMMRQHREAQVGREVILIQTIWRGYFARQKFSTVGRPAQTEAEREYAAATKIQAVYRGNTVRKMKVQVALEAATG
jgi:hypothetical protein